MVKVSVLIASYNRLSDLATCLFALSRQQPGGYELEVCVVNDGGHPIDEVVGRFPSLSIRYTNLRQNVGQVRARNTALEMATGDLIALCDDDDRYLPSHLSGLVEMFDAVGNTAVLAYSDAEIVRLNRDGNRLKVLERRPFAWRDAKSLLSQYNPIIPSSVLYRRVVHQELGMFDEGMSHYWDWDFFLSAAQLGAFQRNPVADVLYAFFTDGANLSANPDEMSPALKKLCAKHDLGRLPTSNFYQMLSDPNLQGRQAPTRQVWDGQPTPWLAQNGGE